MARSRPLRSSSPSGKDESSLEQDLNTDPTHYFEAESRAERTADLPGQVVLDERVVDVVLSDMSAPWEQTEGFWIKSISNPYYRMMNTSGMPFRDHAGSMVRCFLSGGFFSNLKQPTKSDFEINYRTCAMLHCGLHSIHYVLGVILFANSTKVERTKRWS